MSTRRILGAIVLSAVTALPAMSWAEGLLTPKNVDIEVVNGQKAGLGATTFTLKAGNNQVAFEVDQLIRTSGDTERFTSDPIVISFTLEGDQDVTLGTPNFRNIKEARAFEKNPQPILTDSKGTAIEYKLSVLKREGLQFGRNLVEEVNGFNLTDDPAAVAEFAPAIYIRGVSSQTQAQMNAAVQIANMQQAQQTALTPAAAAGNSMSTKMLQYWYNQASREDREAFMTWIQQQQ